MTLDVELQFVEPGWQRWRASTLVTAAEQSKCLKSAWKTLHFYQNLHRVQGTVLIKFLSPVFTSNYLSGNVCVMSDSLLENHKRHNKFSSTTLFGPLTLFSTRNSLLTQSHRRTVHRTASGWHSAGCCSVVWTSCFPAETGRAWKTPGHPENKRSQPSLRDCHVVYWIVVHQFSVVVYLLLAGVQAKSFDQARGVDVLPVAVLQERKQILQMLADGLGLVLWK